MKLKKIKSELDKISIPLYIKEMLTLQASPQKTFEFSRPLFYDFVNRLLLVQYLFSIAQ